VSRVNRRFCIRIDTNAEPTVYATHERPFKEA
jgi:hypothetical protein